ncbi:maleylpyruvate isomerase family mycothiol-dependent enzyme [Actinoplanes hulinensis]|uniref:Maleylpyruvate isomerase family mycothiol-dependent enzyme n=1 Tax=Actinoplanes hulinensis TaxID=1144547 RepID=A0ABS7AWC0_9ACTN|nr:maleylpyruvate isomerase family mycothiol-dependent enzyme [Actinoplanes hulinensis]MBW6432942.1 maleylpyruvate isomerase family mycothiol-dependent enzyme [Actinoplanes hulinensis]
MNRLHATKDFWLAALRADGPALWDAVAESGPDAVVPGCPDWTVADLTHHVATVLNWVRGTVPRGVTVRHEGFVHPERPAEWSEALDHLRREITGTIETLEALDPDLPAWNWAPQPKRAVFWHRRMAHEISVHRWDAESAAGRATPIETKLATDGVSEILDTWLPAGKRQGPTDMHGVVHLVGTDAAQEWFVRLRGTGIALLDTGTILDGDDHHPRARITGTASDLQLALMGRKRADQLALTGDPRLVQALHTG